MSPRRREDRRAGARLVARVLGSLLVAATLAVPAGTLALPATAAAAPTATTTAGRLHGITSDGVDRYLGVRYGRAPVGPLRWATTRPAPRRRGAVDATRAGSPCPQAAPLPGADATASTDEDCLFLNVTAPAHVRRGERLPVMVWWHGGGFQSGSGAAYDAGRLARDGRVVVVTVNYRLGIFGYLGLPGLRDSGNFGLADQIAATRWARRNARAFGGDPRRLTVFGESAGAMSACALLTSPAARGLVDRIALSSGSCALDWPPGAQIAGGPAARPFISRAASAALGASTARDLGCSGPSVLACLRGKTVDELLPASQGFGNAVAFGTPLLPRDPRRAVAGGHVADVPVLSGGTRDEERAFQGGVAKADPTTFTRETYPKLLRTAYGRDAARVARRYPLTGFPSPLYAFSAATTDGSWACPTLRADRQLAGRGLRVFGFEFADRDATDVNGVGGPGFSPGAAHATDVPYLFDPGGKDLVTRPAQRRLARVMVRAWSSFARTGRPEGAGSAPWRPMTATSGRVRQFAPGALRDVDARARHHCDLWDALDR